MKTLIIGRTNVGKSSLFNRLTKRKKALVIDEPGITRDLLKEKTKWWGCSFEIIDSGGWPEVEKGDELAHEILKKIKSAIKSADIFILVVDGRVGLQEQDKQLRQTLRKTGKPLLLFVNKMDQPNTTDLLVAPFFELNAETLSGSCEKNYGIDEIVEWIIHQKNQLKKEKLNTHSNNPTSLIKKSQDKTPVLQKIKQEPTQLFVIGRANSGKSLLCNQILQNQRMIVSSRAGTTLDTVTERFSYNKGDYLVSDNPGARSGTREQREKISFAKSRSELETADIILLVTDALVGPGRQDARLIQLCLKKHKPVILIINKMDLLKNFPPERTLQLRENIKKTFHFYPDLPIVFVSAKTGKNKKLIFKNIEDIKQKIKIRIPTPDLNRFFMQVIRKAPAPVYGTSDVKFYYITQTKKQPPEFIAFANYPKGVSPAYRRFIINSIKKQWGLQAVPILFHALSSRPTK